MLPKLREQLIADYCGSTRHGYGKIENKLLDHSECLAFPVICESLQFLFSYSVCPALGSARIDSGGTPDEHRGLDAGKPS